MVRYILNVVLTTLILLLTCERGLVSVEYLELQALEIDQTVSSPYEEPSPQPSRRTPTWPWSSNSADL